MGCPSSLIVPAVGGRLPDTRFKAVVLPDPLGPMRPTISPLWTVIFNWSTARRPPNLRVRPWSSSSGEHRASVGFDIAVKEPAEAGGVAGDRRAVGLGSGAYRARTPAKRSATNPDTPRGKRYTITMKAKPR